MRGESAYSLIKFETIKLLVMQDEPERALRVLARMRHAKVKPNIRTYELLFSLFGNVNPLYESGNWQSQEDVSKKNIYNRDGHEEKWY